MNGSSANLARSTWMTSATQPSGFRHGNGLPVYLCATTSLAHEVRVGPPLHDPPAELRLGVRVGEVDDRQRHARVASRVARLQRRRVGADEDAVVLPRHPHRHGLRQAESGMSITRCAKFGPSISFRTSSDSAIAMM